MSKVILHQNGIYYKISVLQKTFHSYVPNPFMEHDVA